MKNNSPLVSIVVPVYNISEYLTSCIESIVSQTYSNIEIIVVDDGSTDGKSGIICDNFATRDRRVKVFHKQNGGLSSARNFGIEHSKGEYIAFIDGDDYIDKLFIEKLLGVLINSGADISVCGYAKVIEGESRIVKKAATFRSFTSEDALLDLLSYPSLCEVMTWNKLYRTSLFRENRIVFPEGKIHEDNFTTYKLFYSASRVVFVSDPLYFYIQRGDSIMGQSFNEGTVHLIDAGDEIRNSALKWRRDIRSRAMQYRRSLYVNYLNNYIDSNIDDLVLWSKAIGRISVREIIIGRVSTHKILLLIAKIGPMPYAQVRKRYLKSRGVYAKAD